ncbi:cupin domain-containing protein [Chryseobacterium chendengshani]|uniref:cupin domain-containing protein n=1 Tax=Chryseobacterium sp. LJ756 TaxID=2864113 RepID=UPI001C63D9E7|nr:cupin domain-containing protein [Chryseobacterium sp. LJ756]MBW7674270.1 cupin domain-containing protein [Chryseobacterium sp. LJ756]
MSNNVKQITKNQGRHLSIVGDTYRIIIPGKETNGEFSMIDMLIPPGGGPGPHAHTSFHESFYVVDGEVEFKTEEGKSTAKKGDTITIPKGGAIHSFKNVSNGLAHLLCTVVPAGLDDFFEEIGTPVQEGEFLPPPSLDENAVKNLIAIANNYGQVVYPPNYLDK